MIKIHNDAEAPTPTTEYILGIIILGFVFLTTRSCFGVHRVIKDIRKPVKSSLNNLEPIFYGRIE